LSVLWHHGPALWLQVHNAGHMDGGPAAGEDCHHRLTATCADNCAAPAGAAQSSTPVVEVCIRRLLLQQLAMLGGNQRARQFFKQHGWYELGADKIEAKYTSRAAVLYKVRLQHHGPLVPS
jgi:hypothetical protein